MNTPELLTAFERCQRLGFHSQTWEPWKLPSTEILRRAVDAALTDESSDPGLHASDTVMELCSSRGLEIGQFEVFQIGMHLASLAELISATLLQRFGGWLRPADASAGNQVWNSAAFLNSQGTRLRRYALVGTWNKERAQGEQYGHFTLSECAIYNMPMDLYVVIIGQTRDGRRHAPWSKGWLHPRSHQLRVKRRDGDSFGPTWEQVWREDRAELSRDKWLEAMEEDDVFAENLVQIEIPAPPSNLRQEMLDLISRNLDALAQMKTAPGKAPSQCFWPSQCPLVHHCWYGQPL